MPEATEQPIGPLLDGLGVKAELAETDLLSSAVVLLKVVDADGDVSLTMATSEGCDWIEQAGMIDRARALLDLPERE